jgi:hypothetical protein
MLLAIAPVAIARTIDPTRPNPALTPGAINAAVTQDNIAATICARGWTATIRPSADYTDTLKRAQLAEYGYPKNEPPWRKYAEVA